MFALAIFFARKIFGGELFEILFCTVSFAVLFVICLKFRCVKRFILLLCAFLIGLGYFHVGLATFVGEKIEGEKVVCGRVFDVSNQDTYVYVNLDSVKVNEEYISENVMVYISSSVDIEVGDFLTFKAILKNIKTFDLGEFASQYYKANIAYTCKAIGEIKVLEGYKTVSENINQAISDYTDLHFNSEIAWLFKAVVLGDKSNLSNDIKQDFSASGIGHLLAVSGLHVGFMVAMLTFVLDKLKIKRKYSALIMTLLLFAYCYLCGFSASVVRASIMSLVFVYATCLGRKYDALNCLAVAGYIILLVKPLYVFDAGFLLSFFSVFCIFTLHKPICKLFSKAKFPKILAQSLALTLCVQLGLLPIMAVYYSEFSILSVFTNLLCVPLFQIAYILAFVFLPICLLLPFMTFVLKFNEFLFSIISKIANIVANAKWSFVVLHNMKSIFVILFYVSMFVFSGYIMIRQKLKTVVAMLILFVGIFLSSVYNLPANLVGLRVGACDFAYVLSSNNNVIVIADEYSKKFDKYLQLQNIRHIDYLICLSSIDDFSNIYNNISIIDAQSYDKNVIHDFQDYKIEFVCVGQTLCAIDICIEDNRFLFFKKSNLTYAEIYGLQYKYLGQSIFLCADLNENLNNIFDCKKYVYNDKIICDKEQMQIENWTSEIKNGMLYARSLD